MSAESQPAGDDSPVHLSERPPSSLVPASPNALSPEARAFYLYENQNIDFDDVRDALRRLCGPGHSVTIHDGDACTLFDRVQGNYCAGTVNAPSAAPVATFAIDYVTEEPAVGESLRHVVGLHIGPRGQWCSSLADLDRYNAWLDSLSSGHPGRSPHGAH